MVVHLFRLGRALWHCIKHSFFPSLILSLSLLLAACGGGGGGGGGTAGGGSGPYSVSVTTSGLTGAGLQVGISSSEGTETMSISANGSRTFSQSLPEGTLYSVGIGSQPAGQTCSLGGSFWSTGISSDRTATVTCVDVHSIGGNVSGLTGQLVLRLNGSNSLTLNSNGSFVFSASLPEGDYYAVTVSSQPAGQTCLVSNSGGQMGTTSISNVQVSCSTAVVGYQVGGYISGFSGLAVLQLNGSEELSRTYNGSFTFSSSLPTNTAYTVTVASVSPGYECTVANGTGVIASSDYPFVDIDCQRVSNDIRVQVDPDGAWLDTGESMVLSLNGTESMTLDRWDFSNVSFGTVLNPGDSYEVTVTTPPTGDVCMLANSVGVVQDGVTPVVTIQCVTDTATSYSIGGSISGLTGSGLVLNMDGRDSLAISGGSTSYVFPQAQPNYTSHFVEIVTQPSGQICSVNGSYVSVWDADATNVNVICSPGPYTIGGYAAGVKASGLVLQLNGAEDLSVTASGDFVFNTLLADGMKYSVDIISHPTDQLCTLTNGSGYNLAASKDNIIVDCRDAGYSVAVHMAGYSSTTPLKLRLNDTEIMEMSGNTAYSSVFNPAVFNTRLSDGASYTVSIAAHPEGQFCSLTNASGSISGADITHVGAYCVSEPSSTGPYSVTVTTSGLLGSGLTLQLNGGNDLAVSSNGEASFATSLVNSASYAVSILTQPTSPIQSCEVFSGSGTVNSENVTNVHVQCGSAVQSHYSTNGADWLDYVKNDGANTYSATDTACDAAVDTGGYDVCLNGGEFVSVSVPYLANCTNITATDNLNAFNWVCDDSSGVRLISTGLRSGVGLSDLMDFSAAAFKPNFVSVLDGGVEIDTTQPAIWWNNRVRIDNTGDLFLSSGDIILITGSVPVSIDMSSQTAVLVEPGYSIAGSVTATSKNFLWFEGSIDGANGYGLSWGTADFCVASNIQSTNNLNVGVFIGGNDNIIRNVVANNNASGGINISGNNLVINDLTANDNLGSYGILLYTGNSTLVNMTANGNLGGNGIEFHTSGGVSLSNVTANNNGSYNGNKGVYVLGSWSSPQGPHTFTNITASGNGGYGIYVEGVTDSSFSNITTNNNAYRGFAIHSSNNSSLSNITANGNGEMGVQAFRLDYSSIDQLVVADNAVHGVNLSQSDWLIVSDVAANNNAGHGYTVESSDHIIAAGVLATNNGASGVAYLGSSTGNYQNILIGVTSANNADHGFEMTRMDYLNFSSLAALNNGGNGIYTYTFIDYVTISNLVTANNSGYGFDLGSDNDYYTGLLEMGNNGLGDCLVDTVFNTSTGLVQGGNGNNLDNTCVLHGVSDGTLITAVDASSSVVGKVSSNDSATSDDDATPGSALYDNITGWSSFDHNWRAWGVDGALAFADDSNQGACTGTGVTCRIWDWSASLGDVGNTITVSPAIRNVVGLPTAADTLSMVWTTVSATDQAYCDSNYPGSVWDNGTSCTSTYLRHAREIMGDAIGNDNNLCENGETCLYMPNIGGYQGHGSLISAGTVGTGADTITLLQYNTLGR